MNFQTYIKNRTLFESRFKPNTFGYSAIKPMLKGIRNQDLFFQLYGFDRKFHLHALVYGVDNYKRYRCKNQVGTNLKMLSNISMFDNHKGQFERAIDYLKKK